jgi:hypothetical protein
MTKLRARDETPYGWQVWAIDPEAPVTPVLLMLGTLAEFLARYDVRGGLRQTADQAFQWLNGEAAALRTDTNGETK